MTRPPIPIGQIARRIPEAGRIRTGKKGPEKVSKRTGKTYHDPLAIPAFRFTSAERANVEQVAAIYGGEVKAFSDPKSPDRWQVSTDATEIRVALPPDPLGGTPLYQMYGGGGPERRCDGITCEQWRKGADGPEPYEVDCICAAKGALECDVTTHLSLFLPEIRLTGVWRLTTKSYNAATELPAMVDTIRDLQEAGIVRGVLSLKPHQQVLAGQTRKFLVPTLGVDASMQALVDGSATVGALPAPPPETAALNAGGGGEPAAAGDARPTSPGSFDVAAKESAYGPYVVDDEPVDAEIVEGGDGTFDNREASEGALGRAAASPSSDVRGEPTEANRTSAPSENVDLGDLEALLEDAKKRGATVPGKVPIRRKYNEHIFADEASEAEAGKWADMVPGAALDAAYAWVEAQVSSPSPGEDGRTADDASPPSSGSGQPPAQKALHAAIASFVGGDRSKQDKARHALVAWATNGERDSSSALDGGELSQAIEAVPRLHLRGNGEWEVR